MQRISRPRAFGEARRLAGSCCRIGSIRTRKALAIATLVGELDASLRLSDGFSNQLHCLCTMTALVGSRLPRFAKRLVQRGEGAVHIALIGVGRVGGGADETDRSDAGHRGAAKPRRVIFESNMMNPFW